MKRAVIVGVFGQDGQLLYDLLLKDGYSIVGIGKGKVRSTEGSYLKKIDILKFQQVADLNK
jgi:GDP-D-mannose dehydratase